MIRRQENPSEFLVNPGDAPGTEGLGMGTVPSKLPAGHWRSFNPQIIPFIP